jgi:hypothetical protein
VEAIRRVAVDRNTLVDLIEGETAKLSPRGRELWEELEPLVELSSEEHNTLAEQLQRADIDNRMDDLPQPEQATLDRLIMLYEGLYKTDEAEKRGEETGEGVRDRYVIWAAGLKDRSEGRQVDPDMTVEQAVARLRR